MKPTTPTTLKGFRDFLPEEKRQRDWLSAAMRSVFERHGFAPLETPTLEYAELLLGKYGDEADKLVYSFTDRGDRQVALRYDQTVPTARVLAQYQDKLPRHFRRYQLQNVFRADKPQKGRYREFMQSDCDIFGSTHPLADAEILAVFYAVYAEIGMKSLIIEINDRQALAITLQAFATDDVSIASLTQSLDKIDKIGEAGVVAEITGKGLSETDAKTALSAVKNIEKSDLLRQIEHYAIALGVPASALVYNPYLARGLDYYTGLIFEGKIPEYPVGSIGGGGRYDRLIGELAGLDMSAVGFGIGFDRTLEAAAALEVVPSSRVNNLVFVTVFSEELVSASLEIAAKLRAAKITTTLATNPDQLGKQLKLASTLGAAWAIVVGEEEVASKTLTLKQLDTGEQERCSLEHAIEKITA